MEQTARIWWIGVGAGLAIAAIAIRVNNAILYPLHFGFDGPANWEYIQLLLSSWRLPAPGEGWSTSHPPFFYYVAALLGRIVGGDPHTITVAVRLFSSGVGLLSPLLALIWVCRVDVSNRLRGLVAASLLLFLPVHIYMSAMLGEEILSSALISAVVFGVAVDLERAQGEELSLGWIAGIGLLAGLAFLTKLTGVLVIAASGIAWWVAGWRKGDLPGALARIAVFGTVAVCVGGWPYLHNQIQYGYFYPQNLMVHEIMFTMPPGERFLLDYLRFPLATFSDPQVLAPDLLHSVWGTTYTTLWWDGHRVMLPRHAPTVESTGSVLLLLGLVPTVAFGIGLLRGARRALRNPGGADTVFVALVILTVAGYVLFTWNNPWYATLKASYLLGAAVPFAVYTSEVLADWLRPGHRVRQGIVAALLVSLLAGSAAMFTVNAIFTKREGPGFEWPRVDPSRHYERATPAPIRSGAVESNR
ncbi:MAG: glycosyltransferase family 39 protein [bacterium]|nr:glycosyltransferase family 39 protein [bacterium]